MHYYTNNIYKHIQNIYNRILFNIKNDGNLDIVKQGTWLQKLVYNYKRHKSYDFTPMRLLKHLNLKD